MAAAMPEAPSPQSDAKAGRRAMFFPLSKIVFFLITPSNALILLVLLGAVILFATSFSGFGRALVLIGGLGLLGAGFLPLSAWMLLPLEDRFPAFVEDGTPVTGIIVLGGGIESATSLARDQLTVNDAGERVIALGDLARRFPKARLLFAGGSGSFSEEVLPEAAVLSKYLETLGVPRDRLILEKGSRNTRENAVYAAAMALPKPEERWLLVTSAWHMPRAIGCFRKAGFPVTAYPVDYRTIGAREGLRLRGFASEGLFEVDLAAKEWVGLIAYKLAGYIDDWMPKP